MMKFLAVKAFDQHTFEAKMSKEINKKTENTIELWREGVNQIHLL